MSLKISDGSVTLPAVVTAETDALTHTSGEFAHLSTEQFDEVVTRVNSVLDGQVFWDAQKGRIITSDLNYEEGKYPSPTKVRNMAKGVIPYLSAA